MYTLLKSWGRLKDVVRAATIRKSGPDSIAQKAEAIARMWARIQSSIDEIYPLCGKVRIYQDTLAICGKENDIVKDMAAQGSPNHQLILQLLQRKGVTLMGTESPVLLLREYEAVKRQLGGAPESGPAGASDQALLEQRDRFIADRIDQTLQAGETGIIFLGVLHNLEAYLHRDIHLVYPLYPPASRA